MKNYEEQKIRFHKVFINLPINERSQPIYVDQKVGAISWYILKLEVDNDTKIAIKALEFLNDAEII